MANEQQTQKAPKKGSFFLKYILPVIIGVVLGWFLNAFMMPPNKDAQDLIKTQAEQVQATREGFNKLADAIRGNNMADIVNNANMVGAQLDGLSNTTNKFLAEYKLPVVKGDSVQKVVVGPNPIIVDTGNRVVNQSAPIVPLSTEFKIKVGEKNTMKIDEANFIAMVSENEDNGRIETIFNGFACGFIIGSINNLIPIGKVQKRILFKARMKARAIMYFLYLTL
jgi:hypothetical protein